MTSMVAQVARFPVAAGMQRTANSAQGPMSWRQETIQVHSRHNQHGENHLALNVARAGLLALLRARVTRLRFWQPTSRGRPEHAHTLRLRPGVTFRLSFLFALKRLYRADMPRSLISN